MNLDATFATLQYLLDQQEHDLDSVFRALSNRARRTMIERLSDGPASLGDLAAPLAMTLSAAEQHLRALERCGLVRSEKRGRVRYCRLDLGAMSAAESWIAERPQVLAAVFRADADIERRELWSAPSDEEEVVFDEHDLRVGGIDRFRCGLKGELKFAGITMLEQLARHLDSRA